MSKVNSFVDAVYDHLEALYNKDKNYRKTMLGNEPIKRIFDNYSDWLSTNLALSPKVAANAIYKDLIGINYFDFPNKKLKPGVAINNTPSFDGIYGTPQEIKKAKGILAQLQQENPKKYNLVLKCLQKVKTVSDTVKPAKNLFGKTTNVAKQDVASFKMPKLSTLETFMKMSEPQLMQYIGQLDNTIQRIPKPQPKQKKQPAAPQQPAPVQQNPVQPTP